MRRQLMYTELAVARPRDCARCHRPIEPGRHAIKNEYGYQHPACYADAILDEYDRRQASADRARRAR